MGPGLTWLPRNLRQFILVIARSSGVTLALGGAAIGIVIPMWMHRLRTGFLFPPGKMVQIPCEIGLCTSERWLSASEWHQAQAASSLRMLPSNETQT